MDEPISLELTDRPEQEPAPSGFEDLQSLLGIEECVRYYPPDLSRVDDPATVFQLPDAALLPERPRAIDIFVDVPFCKTICGFCPFNVYPYDFTMARRYLEDLKAEIQVIKARHDFSSVQVGSVWVGGGTPTVMAEEFLDELLTTVRTEFDLSAVREYTVEIKPSLESLGDSMLDVLHRNDIRRISMGVQSTQAHQLRVLGRGHTREEALDVIDLIKGDGFALNIDMMYRLPGQQLAEIDLDLTDVLGRGLDHMSWFPYVPHEGTALAKRIARGRVETQAGRDVYRDMFDTVRRGLGAAGYEQYTPYHFAGTSRCQYHVGRWGMPQRETLGLGPGSFSFFNGWIYANQHDPAKYHDEVTAGRPPVLTGKRLNLAESVTRLAVLGVKLFEIEFDAFRAVSGQDFVSWYAEEIRLLESLGMIDVHPDRISCNDLGRSFNNDVASVFATDTARRAHHPQALDYMRSAR